MQSDTEKSIREWYIAHNMSAPVDLYILCDDLGIEVREAPVPGVALCERRLIVLDSRLRKLERREQLAHEIAHVLKHCGGQFYSTDAFVRQQESQAKNVGQALLAPAYMIEPYLHSGDSLDVMTAILAVQFQMTCEAMRMRLETVCGAFAQQIS